MKIHLPDHSLLLNTQDAVQAICQYMFDELNFDYFDYGHYYDDGRTFHLFNDTGNGCGKSFAKSYYNEGLYITIDELEYLRKKYCSAEKLFGFFTADIAFTDDLPDKAKHRTQMEIGNSFSIGPRIYLFKRYKDYVELSGFGSNIHKHNFYNFCIQNFPILESFIRYFREEAKGLIEMTKKECVTISPRSDYQQEDSRYRNFVGYDFNKNQKINMRLTVQESASLQQLASGKTFKQAAKNLLISPRTVESYIYNARTRIGCQSTHALLEIFSNLASR